MEERREDVAPAGDQEVDQILAGLAVAPPRKLPEEAIRSAQRRSEEIVPHLIRTLESAIQAQRAGAGPKDDAHIFAAYLLTEFRAEKALPVFLDALRLTEEEDDELFGDLTTDLFARTFALLAEGRPEIVDAVIVDRSLGIYPRWTAVDAYLYWVAGETMPRYEGIDRLRKHLRRAIDLGEDEITEALIMALLNLTPSSEAPEIEEVFEKDLAHLGAIVRDDLADSDAYWEEGNEKSLAFYRQAEVLDTVEEMRPWYERGEDDAASLRNVDGDDGGGDYLGSEQGKVDAASLRSMMQLLALELDDADPEPAYSEAGETIRYERPRVGRNDPCPCGSGMKFKKCCGRPS